MGKKNELIAQQRHIISAYKDSLEALAAENITLERRIAELQAWNETLLTLGARKEQALIAIRDAVNTELDKENQ